jgi:tetratricopeptide (TPR) repeat protein
MFLDALALLDIKIPETKDAHKLYAKRAKINDILGNYKGSVEDLDKAIAVENRIYNYYIERGNAYFKLGKYKAAIEDFSKALRQEPAEFSLYIKRAKAYEQLKEYKPAIRNVVTYLKYFEKDREATALCGNLHYLNENYIEALKYFNKNLNVDKSNPEYYKDRGKTYLKSKTYKYAISDFSMALDLSPNDGEAYLLMGIANFATGDKEEACLDWEQAKKNGEVSAIEYLLEHCE